MKFGWNSIKISIAGARLSHLVQENSIWDHGSMIEQVKTVFVYLKKAYLKCDPSTVRKCLTTKAYNKTEADIELKTGNPIVNADLVSVEIISVISSKYNHLNKFKALIKLRKATEQLDLTQCVSFCKTNRMVEQEWLFVHEGTWWLLDEIKKSTTF